jgi:hypothetical protein
MRAYSYATGESIQSSPEFKDNNNVSDWAKSGVGAAAKLGIMIGQGDNAFQPKAETSRAETAMVIYKLITILDNQF